MKITPLHEWNLTPQQAIELQKQFAYEVIEEDRFEKPVETVAGIDLGYDLKTDTCRAVVVVLKFPGLELIESAEANQTPAERKLALYEGPWAGDINRVFDEFAY